MGKSFRNNSTESTNQSDVSDNVNKYQNKSEAELMQELFKNVQAGKRDGSFDQKSLNDFYENIKDSLTPKQRDKMKQLIKMIAP